MSLPGASAFLVVCLFIYLFVCFLPCEPKAAIGEYSIMIKNKSFDSSSGPCFKAIGQVQCIGCSNWTVLDSMHQSAPTYFLVAGTFPRLSLVTK